MAVCNSFPPKCISNGEESILSCKHGEKMIDMYFQYQSCALEKTAQWSNDSGFICTCIHNPFEDCRAEMFRNRVCQSAFTAIIIMQASVIVLALIFNSIVVHAFVKKTSMRKKIPNVLLFMQALVDFINCIVYAFPSPILIIIQQSYKTVMSFMLPMEKATLILSASSSMWLFLIIAGERFISLHKPIWHRLNICSRHIWIVAAVASMLSIVTSTAAAATLHFQHYDTVYVYLLKAALCFFFLVVTILYAWSFKIAYKSKYTGAEANQESLQSKKEFRLVLLFISMYFIFIISLVSLLFTAAMDDDFYNVHTQVNLLIFTMTSLFNPLLTLWLKKDFRITLCRKCRKSHINDLNGELQMNERDIAI